MRKLFFLGIVLLAGFELAHVWFVMPLPFSQRMRSVEAAYLLHEWRWAVRALSAALILGGLRAAWRGRFGRPAVAASLALVAALAYATNVRLAADRMFLVPERLDMQPAATSRVDPDRLVVGIVMDGEARAYPLQFVGYHHQLYDTVAGRPVLVTYCTVCRTGRVFDPVVDGRAERFRLVGMDHFNAMLEDRSTGTWWRQVSGRAVAGPRRGERLAEIPSRQVTLGTWLALHPASLVMQPDPALADRYDEGFDYETGASRKRLTGTDTSSWSDKSWVVGITVRGESRAYDWNRLRRERVINDILGDVPIVIALDRDGASFFAYERPGAGGEFAVRGDSLVSAYGSYDMGGRGAADTLRLLPASQEFWHSWRTFQPATTVH